MISYLYKKEEEPKITYTIIQDVIEEVISVPEVKSFMGIDFPDFDSILPLFIKAAREEAEKYTGLSIGQRIITLAGDFKDEDAYLPFMPAAPYDANGLQVVGYTPETVPADLKLALLNMVHIAFDNRSNGLNFSVGLNLLSKSRRRVGL